MKASINLEASLIYIMILMRWMLRAPYFIQVQIIKNLIEVYQTYLTLKIDARAKKQASASFEVAV